MPIDTALQDEHCLTIQQMARQSGLSEHTLRYYERIGLLEPIARDASSGHRRYSPNAVRIVEGLACLRGVGMSISDLRKFAMLHKQGAATAAEQKALLVAQDSALAAEMEQIGVRRQYLAGKIAYCEALEAGDTDKAAAQAEHNGRIASILAKKQETR